MNDLKVAQLKILIRYAAYFAAFAASIVVISRLFLRYGFDVVIKEDGIIEWLEVLWLLISSLFLFLARRKTSAYPLLFAIIWLVPLIAAVRELDGILDMIFHGAWMVPAGLIAAVAVYKIFRSPAGLGNQFLAFVPTRQAALLGMGFFIVVIFAQLSGRQVIWHALLGEHYVREAGRFVEEWLEELGYVIIAIGSLESYLGD